MDTKDDGKKLLISFDNIELDLLKNYPDYSIQFLNEEGFDVDAEGIFGIQQIKKIKFMTQAVYNKSKDESLLTLALAKVKEAIQDNLEKTTETLIELLQTKTPSVQYRKLENWTDEEIKNVLEDIDVIKLMEELDKDKS